MAVRRGDILMFVTWRPSASVNGEVAFTAGYPFALGLMAASVAAPFIYFRRKGWLR